MIDPSQREQLNWSNYLINQKEKRKSKNYRVLDFSANNYNEPKFWIFSFFSRSPCSLQSRNRLDAWINCQTYPHGHHVLGSASWHSHHTWHNLKSLVVFLYLLFNDTVGKAVLCLIWSLPTWYLTNEIGVARAYCGKYIIKIIE